MDDTGGCKYDVCMVKGRFTFSLPGLLFFVDVDAYYQREH